MSRVSQPACVGMAEPCVYNQPSSCHTLHMTRDPWAPGLHPLTAAGACAGAASCPSVSGVPHSEGALRGTAPAATGRTLDAGPAGLSWPGGLLGACSAGVLAASLLLPLFSGALRSSGQAADETVRALGSMGFHHM